MPTPEWGLNQELLKKESKRVLRYIVSQDDMVRI